MSEIFLSLEEVAELEGVKYNSVVQRIRRNQDHYIVKFDKSATGGRETTWVALSSLSPKARRAYKKKNPTNNELVLIEQSVSSIPWYAETDFDFSYYKCNYGKQYEKGMETAKNIKAFLEYTEDDRTHFADEFAAEMNISQRTLYRYAESYLEAEQLVMQRFKETGLNYEYYKILAMCRKPKAENTFPSLMPEHRAFIENVWFNELFSQNNGTVEMLYTQFERFFKEKNVEYPSYKTVARYIHYLMTEGRMNNAKALATKGVREWKRNNMLKGVRDSSALAVMEIIHGDSHTLDFWVQYKDPNNGKISAIRPTMVAWIDTRSRVIMGDVWAKTINAQVIKQSMAKVIYTYGSPEYIIIDNGKDYTANEMTGRSRKERSSSNLVLDKDAIGFYRSVGIKDDYRALPYQPWVKIIERAFGRVCEQFSKWLESYTGTLTGSKTAAKVVKDIDKLLKEGRLYTMEEAFELWQMWLENTYHASPHRGLKKMGEKYTKPMDLFENAEERVSISPPPPELVQTLLLKPGKARIYNMGINKFRHNYMNYELATYVGKTLPIRYDPADVSCIHVYDEKGKKICTAECQELLGYQGHITEQHLIEHLKMQKKQLKEDRLRLAVATTPLELRGCDGDPMIAGTFDIMLKKKKVEAIECKAEVLEEMGSKGVGVASEYFAERAKEELRKLRNIESEVK